jgi:hypothetical protein
MIQWPKRRSWLEKQIERDAVRAIRNMTKYCAEHKKEKGGTCENCIIKERCHGFMYSLSALSVAFLEAAIKGVTL